MTRWAALPVLLGLLGACGLGAGACGMGVEDEEEAPPPSRVDAQGRVALTSQEQEALGLETEPAQRGTLVTSVLRFGRVVARPDEDALVAAPVTGRLGPPAVALGATVEAGDELLSIEPLTDAASGADLRAQRRELVGRLEGARAQVEAKRSDLERVRTLVETGLATEADRRRAEAALESERARAVSLQRASGELGRMTGGRLVLRAPGPGVVVRIETDAGAQVSQGTVLARIVRAGPRWIDVAVPPADAVGDGYVVEGVEGGADATLASRGQVVHPDGTRRDRLVAAAESAPTLPPGATLPVRVLHETEGIVVPVGAVVRRGSEHLCFVAVEEGLYAPRSVDIAARDDERAVISSGLSARDDVVVRGASSLLGELERTGEAEERE